MEMYELLLKRLITLTDEYFKLRKELNELKEQVHPTLNERFGSKRIIPMKIEKNKIENNQKKAYFIS